MTALSELYASASRGVWIVRTLELQCSAWSAPELICNGFRDLTCGTEDGRTVTFIAANIDITLPKKNNKGNQSLAFSVDNTTGYVQRLVDLSLDADARVTAIYRTYTSDNLAAPAERPYFMTVMGGSLQGIVAQLQCGYFNMIGTAWPRISYTPDFVPGLRYN